MKKMIIPSEIKLKMKTFTLTSFRRFCLSPNRKQHVIMRDMTKKLNIFTRQLPICYVLE